MRYSLVFMIVMLGALFCSAQNEVGDIVRDALNRDLNWTENFTVNYFLYNETNYAFVAYNGTETFVVKIMDSGGAVVWDNDTISLLLKERDTNLLTETVGEIRDLLVTFNQSRAYEANCKVALGLDRAPCTDRNACLRACAYSQYLCLPMAQGIGWTFLDAMAAFYTDALTLDVDSGELFRGIDSFINSSSKTLPNETLITDMSAHAASINSNSLFSAYSSNNGGFEFCTQVPYRTDALDSAKSKLTLVKSRLAANATNNSTRDYIVNQTLVRMRNFEAARARDKGLVESARGNASAEFSAVYKTARNATQLIIGPDIDSGIAELNASLNVIQRSDNASLVMEEYAGFMNKSTALKASINSSLSDFDEIVTLGNIVSSVIAGAERNITSGDGRDALEKLKVRKGQIDAILSKPVDARYLTSLKAELSNMKTRAEAIADGEIPSGTEGLNYVIIGAAVAVLAALGVIYWLFSTGRMHFGPLKAGGAPTKADGSAPKANAPMSMPRFLGGQKPAVSKLPTSQHKVRLVMKGGAYRTKIRTLIKNKDGNPAPDGTVVRFNTDVGNVTPSAVTKGGLVYASMVFKTKVPSVTVTVTALGVERKAKIIFV